MNGIQEVSGSIPLISTTRKGTPIGVPFSFGVDTAGRTGHCKAARGYVEAAPKPRQALGTAVSRVAPAPAAGGR